MKEVNRRKGYKENTIHSSEVHTLAEEEKPDEGPGRPLFIAHRRPADWPAKAYQPAYWASSHYPCSGESLAAPGCP
jgi:hypothetical protein